MLPGKLLALLPAAPVALWLLGCPGAAVASDDTGVAQFGLVAGGDLLKVDTGSDSSSMSAWGLRLTGEAQYTLSKVEGGYLDLVGEASYDRYGMNGSKFIAYEFIPSIRFRFPSDGREPLYGDIGYGMVVRRSDLPGSKTTTSGFLHLGVGYEARLRSTGFSILFATGFNFYERGFLGLPFGLGAIYRL